MLPARFGQRQTHLDDAIVGRLAEILTRTSTKAFPMRRSSSSSLCLFVILAVCSQCVSTSAQTPAGQAAPTQFPIAQPQAAQAVAAPLAQVANLPQQPGQPAQQVTPQQPMGPPRPITDVEQQFVDQILLMWETESAKINNFNSRFERWEYDMVFGPGLQIPFIKSVGQVTYSKPDKGSFKIEEVRRWTKQDPKQETWEPGDWLLHKEEVGEHWVCDGKAVFEYKHDKKQLVVQPLPLEMQGKSIVDGPLPFLFGAKADKLKRRYWIYSKQSDPQTIWLEAHPRSQADKANYDHVDVMLDRKSMQPKAIRVHAPNNKSQAVYMFDTPTINGKLNAIFGNLFSAPRTPLGWTRVVQNPPVGPQGGPQAANSQPTTTR